MASLNNTKLLICSALAAVAINIICFHLAVAEPQPLTSKDSKLQSDTIVPDSATTDELLGSGVLGAPCPGPDNFYPIYSTQDLLVMNQNRDGSYRLCNDIELPDDFSYPINPGSNESFLGILDGNGFAISNVKSNLFRFIGGGTYAPQGPWFGWIRNLTLVRPSAPRSLERYTGVLAASLGNNSRVENLEIIGGDSSLYLGAHPYGNDDIGFLASAISNASISNIKVSGTLVSRASINFIGGVVSKCFNSDLHGIELNIKLVRDPSSYANPQGAGGVVGGMIETFGCNVSGVRGSVDISIGQHVGGIVGQFSAQALEINNAELVRSRIDRHDYPGSPGYNLTAGGLVGSASGELVLQDSLFSGEIRGEVVGGAVGAILAYPQYGIPTPQIRRVEVLSNRISGFSSTGGLIGNSYTSSLQLEDSFARADLTTEGYSGSAYGGLIGAVLDAQPIAGLPGIALRSSYFSGTIDTQGLQVFCVSGVIGCIDQSADTTGIHNVYFNSSALDRNDSGIGQALSEQQMLSGNQSVFAGFDFKTIWAPLNAGKFPELRGMGLCPADVNWDGLVSVQDLLDFLEAYFSSHNSGHVIAPADWDGSGAVNVQDIFSFLTDYHSPCNS